MTPLFQAVALSLIVSPLAFGAATYTSISSTGASPSLTTDLLNGIAPTGTATREGGDSDTTTIGLSSLTDGVTGTTISGRSFVNPGTLDYDLGGTFDVSTIYFRLVNPVRDSRLSFLADVSFSYDEGSNYTLIAEIVESLTGVAGDFGKTGTLSNIEGKSVTNIRIELFSTGSYSSSFSEIDVVGTAVPEPSGLVLLTGAACMFIARRRRC